jgi:hypothetical protein
METAATLREHLRVSGMGLTTMRYFRDKLAMRMRALDRGVRVPDFVPVFNHNDIRYYLENVQGRSSSNWGTSSLLICWRSSFQARSITWTRWCRRARWSSPT